MMRDTRGQRPGQSCSMARGLSIIKNIWTPQNTCLKAHTQTHDLQDGSYFKSIGKCLYIKREHTENLGFTMFFSCFFRILNHGTTVNSQYLRFCTHFHLNQFVVNIVCNKKKKKLY